MRRLVQIGIVLFVFMLFGAPSCNDHEQGSAGRKQKALDSAMDSLRESFGSDQLSAASLEAFEVSASQKLSDFADYLRIMGDTTLNPSFKEKAKEMVRDLFLSENVRFRLVKGVKAKEEVLTLKQLLSAGDDQIVLSSNLIFDSVKVSQHFQRADDTTYTGWLNFTLRCTETSLSGKEITCITGNAIDIFILKRNKIFGNDTLNIWKVYLGDLR
jgi:hypothetical protein